MSTTTIWICLKTTFLIVILFVISKNKILAQSTVPPAPSTEQFGNQSITAAKFYPQNLSFCSTSTPSLQTTISKAWEYIHNQYGPFKPDIGNGSNPQLNPVPVLCVIFPNENETQPYPVSNITKTGNESSSNKEGISEECSSSFVLHFKTAITPTGTGPSDCPAVFLDEILTQIATMVMGPASDLTSINCHWPAKNISGNTLTSILVYDIYSKLDMKAEGETWKERNWNKSEITPQSNNSLKRTFWFRDWYFPIYEKYGNSTALKDFLTILRNQSGRRENMTGTGDYYEKEINMGEFIHLWSGAARVNLQSLATRCFKWSQGYQIELEEARKIMPIPTYDFHDDERNFEIPDCRGINVIPIILGIVIPATFVAALAFGLRLFKKVERRRSESEDRDSLLFQVNYDDLEDFNAEEDRRIRQFLDDRFI